MIPKRTAYVRITKLRESASPLFPAGKFDEYKFGDFNEGVSVPIHYWAEGFLIYDLAIGSPLVLDRRNRNGVPCVGIFRTSFVQRIGDGFIVTDNSVYAIKEIS